MTKTETFTEDISWNQHLDLFSKGKYNYYTAICQESPAVGLFDGEGVLEAQTSCFYLLNRATQSILLAPDHKSLIKILEMQDKQQYLHKKAGVCYACAKLRIVVVLQRIPSGSTYPRKRLSVWGQQPIHKLCRGQFRHAQQVYAAKIELSSLLVFCDNSLTIRREALTSAFWIDYPCVYIETSIYACFQSTC